MELTLKRAKELETVLENNGFSDISLEIFDTYKTQKSVQQKQLECEHSYPDVLEFLCDSYWSVDKKNKKKRDVWKREMKKQLADKQLKEKYLSVYNAFATCSKCGATYSAYKSNQLKKAYSNFDDEHLVTVRFGCTKKEFEK